MVESEADRYAVPGDAARASGGKRPVISLRRRRAEQESERVGAERFDQSTTPLRRTRGFTRLGQDEMLGPQTRRSRSPGLPRAQRRARACGVTGSVERRRGRCDVDRITDCGMARSSSAATPMKPATNRAPGGCRCASGVSYWLRCPRLQHDDAVGERHRLDLVVRDIDDRGAEALMQLLDLDPHLGAQLRVEVGERLVEQEGLGLRARWRGPSRRAAAGRRRAAAACGREGAPICRMSAASSDARPSISGFGEARASAARTPCSRRRLVRIERVILEHHRDVAARAAAGRSRPCRRSRSRRR